jgi:hypothetical protein
MIIHKKFEFKTAYADSDIYLAESTSINNENWWRVTKYNQPDGMGVVS